MTKHRHVNQGTNKSRPSVFDRLDGKSSSSTSSTFKNLSYCRSWLSTGTCSHGKNCKYVNSHINLSGSTLSRFNSKTLSGRYLNMKGHSSKKGKKDLDMMEEWDQNEVDLERVDEKVLEKRLELLKRQLDSEDHHKSHGKHHSRSKTSHIGPEKKKRKHSSSSSNSRSSSSSSASSSSDSSSSSSSSDEDVGALRYKHKNVQHRSVSSSTSPKKPKSFQKHNKVKHNMSPDKRPRHHHGKPFQNKQIFKRNSPTKSRHRSPPLLKRKKSPMKQKKSVLGMKKDKARPYSPPLKRDKRSHSPRRANDKRSHSPKRARLSSPHRVDIKQFRKNSPNRDFRNRNQRMNQQKKSPPLRRNMDRMDDRGGKHQHNNNKNNMNKGRFDKNKDDNRRNNFVQHDNKRPGFGFRRQFNNNNNNNRDNIEDRDQRNRDKSIDKQRGDNKKRDLDVRHNKDNRGDFSKNIRDRPDNRRLIKDEDRFQKGGNRVDQSIGKHLQRGDDRRTQSTSSVQQHPLQGRTPAQGRILDRILERRSYLGERNNDKDKMRDRGLERVHSDHSSSRAGSREHSEFKSRDDRYTEERMSPGMRGTPSFPEEKRNWNNRAGSFEETEGDWERLPNKWERPNNNRRNEWGGPSEYEGNSEWKGPPPLGQRVNRSIIPEGLDETKRIYHKKDRMNRSGEVIEEELSDISDDADEILNRDEEVRDSDDVTSGTDEEDYQRSAHIICGPMQDPLTQRLLADDFDLDFEDASDEDVDSTKATISDALGVDWASLVEDTKPKIISETAEKSCAKYRWEPSQIFARLGISESLAGKDVVDNLKQKYSLDKISSSTSDETTIETDSTPAILNPIPAIHSALKEKIEARRQLFDPLRRALSARHDLAIRKQICGYPVTLLQQVQQTLSLAT